MFHKRNIITAIEIGTSKICVLIGESDDEGNMVVAGHGEKVISGIVVKGEIVDMDKALEVLTDVIDEADKAAGRIIDPEHIYLAVTSSGIISEKGTGTVFIQNANGKIAPEDIEAAVRNARSRPLMRDRTAINYFDSYFILDGHRQLLNPLDQVARKLEAYIHIVHGDHNRIENFKSMVHDAGFDEEPTPVFSGVAAAYGVLTEAEKENGVIMVDIGAGTTEYIAVYNFGILHSGVLQLGFEHVANDLHVGLDLPIKLCRKLLVEQRGTDGRSGRAVIQINGSKLGNPRKIPVTSIEKIIDLRIREIFKIIHSEMLDRKANIHFASGGVLTGGGALFPKTAEIFKSVFQVPVRIGKPENVGGAVSGLDSPRYSAAWGLLKFGDEMRRVMDSQGGGGIFRKLLEGIDAASMPLFKGLSSLKDSIKF